MIVQVGAIDLRSDFLLNSPNLGRTIHGKYVIKGKVVARYWNGRIQNHSKRDHQVK